jgi:hypothetical protein
MSLIEQDDLVGCRQAQKFLRVALPGAKPRHDAIARRELIDYLERLHERKRVGEHLDDLLVLVEPVDRAGRFQSRDALDPRVRRGVRSREIALCQEFLGKPCHDLLVCSHAAPLPRITARTLASGRHRARNRSGDKRARNRARAV